MKAAQITPNTFVQFTCAVCACMCYSIRVFVVCAADGYSVYSMYNCYTNPLIQYTFSYRKRFIIINYYCYHHRFVLKFNNFQFCFEFSSRLGAPVNNNAPSHILYTLRKIF